MYADSVTAKRKTSWYGVRTLFRLVATGRPKILDKSFDPASTLVEDRVVLFKADGFESAIKQAKDEASQYCNRTRFANIYGQSVRLNFLGAVDAFAIADARPSAGCEVYSSTAIVPRSVSNSKIINERFEKRKERGVKGRYKFLDDEILTGALTAIHANQSARPKARRRS
jgi:hypothetical protein